MGASSALRISTTPIMGVFLLDAALGRYRNRHMNRRDNAMWTSTAGQRSASSNIRIEESPMAQLVIKHPDGSTTPFEITGKRQAERHWS